MAQRPLVSIVTPFYNEGEGVKHFYQVMAQTMEQLPNYDFELVCVDDGSRDNSLEQLIAISKADPRVTVLEFSRNFGKEPAMTAGIDAATGDCVIPMDADLQDPPALISEMLKKWQEGAEVVLAKRVDRSTDSYSKRTTALLFYRLHNALSHLQIPENVGDYRLMDRIVVDALKQLPERQRFMKGLFAWVGFKTATVEYARDARLVGDSKFSGWKLWNFAIEGITSFSLVPLKVWTYVGGIGALIAFLYGLFVIIKTLVLGIDVPGYASLIVLVLLFGSLQLIGIGVLGEYISRIYMESKRRPIYIIRNRHEFK